MQWIGQGETHMTMSSDGRLGINAAPEENTLLFANTDIPTTAHFKNTSQEFGTAVFAQSNFAGIFAEGPVYGGFFTATQPTGHALFADGNSWINGKLRISDLPSTTDLPGQLRYNSTLNDFEGYNGSSWVSLTKSNNTISGAQTVTDIDGNVYRTVVIGSHTWMRENLKVSRYRNGDIIPEITRNIDWTLANEGGWCWYDNDSKNDRIYGKLYNWFTVEDTRGVCPTGWHVPTENEWIALENALSNSQTGGKTKATGTFQEGTGYWKSPNSFASNETGFTGLPGGLRVIGFFQNLSERAAWWSSTTDVFSASQAHNRVAEYDNQSLEDFRSAKSFGSSIRCVKD